jgi:predicted transposase YbfD/YdcC
MTFDLQRMLWDEVPDIRRKSGNFRHKLSDILLIALCSTMAGGKGFNDMEFYGETKRDFFKSFLDLPNGIPDADTFRRVLEKLSPEEFQKHLANAREMLKEHWQVISIDGKTLRGSRRALKDPFHVVSAYVKEKSLTLGQVTIDEKSNEITAIPKLLDLIDITGDVITIDAIGTQQEIARKIFEKKADYVLAVKGNQKELHHEIQEYFKTNKQPIFQTTEKSRDRIENREYQLCTDPEFIKWLSNGKWAGLRAIGKVSSSVTHKGKTSVVERYYISTLVDTEKFAKCVRSHWGIESMHWILDVIFREDECRSRNAALNLNILRKTAITLLKQIEIWKPRASIRGKMMVTALDPTRTISQLFK